jgi:hypothetical protein
MLTINVNLNFILDLVSEQASPNKDKSFMKLFV